jgi:hypothetical protein
VALSALAYNEKRTTCYKENIGNSTDSKINLKSSNKFFQVRSG